MRGEGSGAGRFKPGAVEHEYRYADRYAPQRCRSGYSEKHDYQHISEKRAEEIKRLLKNYDGMPARLRAELDRFGFVITEDGKHYKLTYFGDGRYQTTFSKTPSDVRTGKNSAQEILRKML